MFQFQMSIDSWVNSSGSLLMNDLLMDELKVNYFAPKW